MRIIQDMSIGHEKTSMISGEKLVQVAQTCGHCFRCHCGFIEKTWAHIWANCPGVWGKDSSYPWTALSAKWSVSSGKGLA